jgi:hypothetical protein
VRLPRTSAPPSEHAALWDLVCRQAGVEGVIGSPTASAQES